MATCSYLSLGQRQGRDDSRVWWQNDTMMLLCKTLSEESNISLYKGTYYRFPYFQFGYKNSSNIHLVFKPVRQSVRAIQEKKNRQWMNGGDAPRPSKR